MPRKSANEIVSSLNKRNIVAFGLKLSCTSRVRACIITLFVYNEHIVQSWVVVKHCNIENSKSQLENGESSKCSNRVLVMTLT